MIPGWLRSAALWLVLRRDPQTRHYVLTTTPFGVTTAAAVAIITILHLWLPPLVSAPMSMAVGAIGIIVAGVWFNLLLGGYQGQELLRATWRDNPVRIKIDSTQLDPRVAYLAAPVTAFCGYVFVCMVAVGLAEIAVDLSPNAFLLQPHDGVAATGGKEDALWATLSFMFFVEKARFILVANDAIGHIVAIVLVMVRSLMIVLLLPTLLQSVLAIRAARPARP